MNKEKLWPNTTTQFCCSKQAVPSPYLQMARQIKPKNKNKHTPKKRRKSWDAVGMLWELPERPLLLRPTYQNWVIRTMTTLRSIITITTGNAEHSSGHTSFSPCSQTDRSVAHHWQQQAAEMSWVSVQNLHKDAWNHPAIL